MIVTFPFAFAGKERDHHKELANLFIKEIRKVKPAVELVQMTDMDTVRLDGIDACYRRGSEPFAIWLFNSMIEFPAEQFLRLDYDIILQSDVSDVFEKDFDIAIADEGHEKMNNGVVFVKDKEIFRYALFCYMEHTGRDDWQDIQRAMQMAIDSENFNVLRLPPDIYNCYSSRDGSPHPESAKIVHFKGGRKKRMIDELTRQVAA